MITSKSTDAEKRQNQRVVDPALTERRAISPAELGRQLGVSTASALRACRDGRVRSIRFGKRFLIPADEAERLLSVGMSAA
jgi:excisionase family DNA binding protein